MIGLKQLCDNGDQPTWQPHTPPDVEKMARILQSSLDTIEKLEQRVKLLETKQLNYEASDMNARAYRMDHSAHLQPLRDVHTGRYIHNFPNTFSELDQLDSYSTDEILRALDINVRTDASVNVKREYIRRKWLLIL